MCRARVILSTVLNKHNSTACQQFRLSDIRSGDLQVAGAGTAGRREAAGEDARRGCRGERSRLCRGRGRERGARGGEVRGAAKPRPDPSRPVAEDGGKRFTYVKQGWHKITTVILNRG